jgi:hypothetical protein
MGSWIAGFIFGMAVGTSVMSASMQAAQRRTRVALEALLAGGSFELYTADGQPAGPAGLLEALDAATGVPAAEARSKKIKWVALLAAGVAAIVGFSLATMTR